MKSPAQEAYEEVETKLLRAPGMIEESERRLLFKAAFNCKELPIVEFGAFFGASTLALASGLSSRASNLNQLICIDAFEVEKNHGLHKHVVNFARKFNAVNLLTNNGNKTNWIKITQSVLGEEQSKVKLIKGIVGESLDLSFLPEKIGLLHLDLPKDAKTMEPILEHAFPRLSAGSIVVFQDYAYQFSNELISFFELLEQKSQLMPTNIAASSMFYKVCTDRISGAELRETMKHALNNQQQLIKDAIKKYEKYPSIRKSELVAMHAAAIRAISTEKGSIEFEQQTKVADHIKKMFHYSGERAAFILAELMTEKLDHHR